MLVSLVGALTIGFIGVAYVAKFKLALTDPETIFILFSEVLFHPIITGFLLAAILAAIMSTISSQLLVSSSSITDDFYRNFVKRDASQKELVFIGRLSVLTVAVIAGALALDRNSSVLSLVSNAWAGFGAAFGPLVLFSLFWRKMTKQAAMAGMVVGATTVLLWIYLPFTINGQSLSSTMYEIVPGFICASIAIWLVGHFLPQQDESVLKQFDQVADIIEKN